MVISIACLLKLQALMSNKNDDLLVVAQRYACQLKEVCYDSLAFKLKPGITDHVDS